METILIILTILWLLIGIIAVWREYHGCLKLWYNGYQESCWYFDKKNNKTSAIRILCYMAPILILAGVITLFVLEASNSDSCWYFTTPKNKK
jgi:hypothetical protein